MKKSNPSFPSIALLIAVILLSAFSHPVNSYAYNQCNYVYEALLDTDNNVNTGGDVGVVQGTESPHFIHGIDYRVQVDLDICQETDQLGPTRVLRWNGSAFVEQPNSPYADTYNIGRMQGDLYDGVNHSDVIEFKALKSDIGNPQGSMKIVYHATSKTNPDSDYTDPFYDPPLPASIPTLSQWGMIIFSLLLSAIALIVLRKRNSASAKLLCSLFIVLSITGIVSANFVCPDKICLDGLIEDWTEIAATPAVTDTVWDSSANDAGEDIFHGYITSDNDYEYFRIDIVGGCTWTNIPSSTTFGEEVPIVIEGIVEGSGSIVYSTEEIGQLPPDLNATPGPNTLRISGRTTSTAGDGPDDYIDYPFTLVATDPAHPLHPLCEYPITLRVDNTIGGGGGD